jgi:hypothetical protein
MDSCFKNSALAKLFQPVDDTSDTVCELEGPQKQLEAAKIDTTYNLKQQTNK